MLTTAHFAVVSIVDATGHCGLVRIDFFHHFLTALLELLKLSRIHTESLEGTNSRFRADSTFLS